ncbi:DNA translocase FtsK [Salirhabdus salicampi]|uniref:DNA translocase FtsK n=1 Tax=Salirhabdus salicampi TaxID=476102 RepID=UPI0020C23D7F|nr:DNA translocase FtsK [Salirhabdus salicampi]MCP8617151.1 DNA translocase FtsK [Salirhabdus salicampi]
MKVNRIIHWLQNWLKDEEDSSALTGYERDDTSNAKKIVQAKMSYQYPKKGSFRFPIIPDDERPNKESRKRDRYPVTDEKVQQHKQHTDYDRPLFRPTDVPSPIYGFQKKKDHSLVDEIQEIEEVPSFVRKETRVQKENNREETTINPKEFLQVDRSSYHLENQEKLPHSQNNHTVKPIKPPTTIREHVKKQPTVVESSEQTSHSNNENEDIVHFQDKVVEHRMFNKHEESVERTQPPYHLLKEAPLNDDEDQTWIHDQKERLEITLEHFNVKAKVTNVMKGPTVTRFEVQPDLGVKVNKITKLVDDIKLNLAAKDIRMEAPIPGKHAIGIEVPNQEPEPVGLSELLDDPKFKDHSSPLTVALGKDIEGETVVTDLQKMPHGLIAGATGSGKSVCINTILLSLLFKASEDEVKFLLIDPKMVELAPYNDIPHLVAPVITDAKAATTSLKWAVKEMESRYEKFAQLGVRDIERYNRKVSNEEKLPFLVIVIDELADLMMVSPRDVEDAICRIAQKARACGMHLLLATQRPSVDVVTGLIKANIPTRMVFSVSSQVDSRTIIDTNGAEKLLGKGDMLFLSNGSGKPTRIQGAFVSDEEIEQVTEYLRQQSSPQYIFREEQLIEEQNTLVDDEDELLYDVIDFVLDMEKASTSMVQRQFSVGYNRAAKLIDRLEQLGIITPQNGSKPRELLMNREQTEAMLENW